MAKTKKKKTQNQAPLSNDAYMRIVMRKLPVDKCYVNMNWKEHGMANVVIVRRRHDGRFAFVMYLVDTYCLGVKDAFWRSDFEKEDLDDLIKKYKERIGIEECDYATVHNLILGAIEFAEEAGINPCKEWNIAQYGLDEDSDEIPLIEFDYGLNGKHFLYVSTRQEANKYLPILKANLGDDFYYEIEDDPSSNNSSEERREEEEYIAPENADYPAELNLKHPEIAEILCAKDNLMVVPTDQMAKIAAINRDEIIADLHQLALYELGKLGGRIPARDEEPDDAAIFHIVAIINSLADSRALDTLLAILRMHPDVLDFYFGDTAPHIFESAISNCCEGRLADLESFLNEPGRTWYNRALILDAFDVLRQKGCDDVNDIIRRQLESMTTRVPELKTADASFSGFLCIQAMHSGDRSMLPIIKELYDNDLIGSDLCGPYEDVEKDYGEVTEQTPMTMSNIYCWIKHFQEPEGDDYVKYNEPDYNYLWTKEEQK